MPPDVIPFSRRAGGVQVGAGPAAHGGQGFRRLADDAAEGLGARLGGLPHHPPDDAGARPADLVHDPAADAGAGLGRLAYHPAHDGRGVHALVGRVERHAGDPLRALLRRRAS